MIVEINGQQVELDDSFGSMTPAQQESMINEVASHMGENTQNQPQRSEPTQSSDSISPVTGAIYGGMIGAIPATAIGATNALGAGAKMLGNAFKDANNPTSTSTAPATQAPVPYPEPVQPAVVEKPASMVTPATQEAPEVVTKGAQWAKGSTGTNIPGAQMKKKYLDIGQQMAETIGHGGELAGGEIKNGVMRGPKSLAEMKAEMAAKLAYEAKVAQAIKDAEITNAAQRRAVDYLNSKQVAPKPTAMQRIGQLGEHLTPTGVAGKALNSVAPILSMAGAGAEGVDAYNRFNHGDYGRGIISGLGALGSAASMLPNKYARGLGTAAATAAPVINAGLDKILGREGYADGGAVQHFGRGGQPDQGGPMTTDRVINDIKSFSEPLTALGDTLASGLRSSTAATLGAPSDIYNLASAVTGDRLGHAPYGSDELKQMLPEVTNDPARMNSNLVKMASAAGDWTPLAGPGEIARGIKGVGKLAGSEINKAMMGEGNNMLRAITPQPLFAAPTSRTISNFDPRFENRVKELPKVQNMVVHEEQTGPTNIPKVDITQYEGYPFITGMADRTGAGSRLLGINNVMFKRPVNRTGGQHFMYNNPDYLWAGGDVPTDDMMRLGAALKDFTGGKDPLFIPWQMSPSGSDFSHMTGETMLAHADAAMSASQKKALDNHMRSIIPDWKGINDPSSVDQFLKSSSNVRKQVQDILDKRMRDNGGIGLGQARLAITDPEQLVGSDGRILHIGQLHPDKPVLRNSGNFSYPSFAPGVGLGQVSGDHNIYQLLREKALQRGLIDPANPDLSDLRALQMGPQAGILTEKTFRNLGYKQGGLAHLKEAA
jgi:hypothetical protein